MYNRIVEILHDVQGGEKKKFIAINSDFPAKEIGCMYQFGANHQNNILWEC
jgi:hypothetical protein